MNRYTQLSTSSFNPLSFEELAVNPAMKRKQHDDMQANAINLKSQLNAYADTLPGLPREYANQLSNEMNSLADEFAGRLNENGVSGNMTSDMIALNRKYQDLLSPQGELGLLNAQKKDYIKKYEDFMKSAKDMKHSEQDAAAYWNRVQAGFTGFDKDGNIKNVDSAHAPERLELIDFMKDRKQLLGQVKSRLDSIGGGSFAPSGDGKFIVVRNQSGAVHKVTNIPGLEWIQADYQNTFLNPNSKGYKSNEFRNITPMESTRSFVSMLNSMVVNEVTDTRSTDLSLVKDPAYLNAKERYDLNKSMNEDNFLEANPGGLMSTGTDISVNTKYSSASEMLKAYNNLKGKVNSGKASNAEISEFNSLKETVENPNGVFASKEYKDAQANFTKVSKEQSEVFKQKTGYDLKDIRHKNGKYYDKNGKELDRAQDAKVRVSLASYNHNMNKAKGKIDKLNEKVYNEAVINEEVYSLSKGANSTMNTLIDNTNDNIVNFAINKLTPGAITNIRLTDGTAVNLGLDAKKEVIDKLRTLSGKDIDQYMTFKINSDGSTTHTIKIPKGDKLGKTLVGTYGFIKDLSGGFELSFKTSKNENIMGVPTATGHQLNALGSSNAGYNDQRYATESRGANYNYRYNATTGKPLSYGDALGMLTGGIPGSHFSTITGSDSSASVNAVVERAMIKANADIYNHMNKTEQGAAYYGSLTEEERHMMMLEYMKNNADKPIY